MQTVALSAIALNPTRAPTAQQTADGEPPTGASGLGAAAIVGAVVAACVALGVSVAYAARARRIKARAGSATTPRWRY